jgi:hypothetical protein
MMNVSDAQVHICHCLTVFIDPNFAMMRPYLVTNIDIHLRRKIAAHLITNYTGETTLSVARMTSYIPLQMEEWKKIKILDQDELVWAAVSFNGIEATGRDNTFIKVSCWQTSPFYSLYIYQTVSRSGRHECQ